MAANAGETKVKLWEGICYPENMRDDWQDEIDDILQVPFAYAVHDIDHDQKIIAVRLDERRVAHIADALDRQNPRLALGARDSVEELRQLKVSHLGALAFPRPAQHGYVPLHG